MNSDLESRLKSIVEELGGRLSGQTGRNILLHIPPAQSLVLVAAASEIMEWVANGKTGRFKPPLSPGNYTKEKAVAALRAAMVEARVRQGRGNPKRSDVVIERVYTLWYTLSVLRPDSGRYLTTVETRQIRRRATLCNAAIPVS